MKPTRSRPAPRTRRRPAGRGFLALAVATAAVWAAPAGGAPPGPGGAEGLFRETGRLDLLFPPEVGSSPVSTKKSGWLILNTVRRRGYQVFEYRTNVTRTVVQSFDLDTLRPLRRVTLSGAPVTSGIADAAPVSSTFFAGEVVHAVDAERGRIYLALSQTQRLAEQPRMLVAGTNFPPDGRRPLVRFVALDEAAIERGDPAFASSFRAPAGQDHLHQYWVLGMKVNRLHVPDGAFGRLLVLFAQPHVAGRAPPVDHTLAQWDPADLAPAAGDALLTDGEAGGDTPAEGTENVAAAGTPQRLDACAGRPLGAPFTSQGNYQWGLLVTRDSVWTACQGVNSGAGGAVRAALDPTTGLFPAVPRQEAFPLSANITDVLVDDGGARLLVRTAGNGNTWWVFDAGRRRFTGAVAAKPSDVDSLAAGLDPTTGRLYQLTPDHEARDSAGRRIPVRGGLSHSDTRLDPAPPLENVRPDLAYPAAYAIRVDPVTRRLFVRRGHGTFDVTAVYPGVDSTTPAPTEPFYRVIEDRLAVTRPPPPIDDAAFTTDTAEDPALTRASYLGSGSGYGTRTLFVGGVDAAAGASPGCGRDDRELVVGSVRGVEVSDLSATADAASLDADGRTRDDFDAGRCLPNEFGFDDAGHPGENRYRAACVGEGDDDATAPSGRRLPRQEFRADASCDHPHGRAGAGATGAFSPPPQVDAAQAGARGANRQVPEEPVRVGWSHSEISVVREPGKGIVVRAEAIARTVVVPGVGTIGAVRAVATATATGRTGGAGATYSRRVCGVDFPSVFVPGCLDETEQAGLERAMNEDLRGRGGRVRFRPPDPVALAGSPSGYRAGVRRPAADAFEDVRVSRDTSAALPGMELVFYRGDSPSGPARQFVHLAGVDAGVSYGLACLYGQRPDGRCARAGDDLLGSGPVTEVTSGPDGTEVVTVTEPGETVLLPGAPSTTAGGERRTLIRRILEAPVRLVQDALRLLFANPREFGLTAAVWALLWAPCWLGERRRAVAALRARRAAVGGAT